MLERLKDALFPGAELPHELAAKIRSTIFWSYYMSQGEPDVQNKILRFAVLELTMDELKHIASSVSRKDGFIHFSKKWQESVNAPLIDRVKRFVGTRAHRRGTDENDAVDSLLGASYVSKSVSKEHDPASHVVYFVETAEKIVKEYVYGEQVKGVPGSIAQAIAQDVVARSLERDFRYLRDGEGRTGNRVGKATSGFADPYLSHVCHYGILKNKFPRDMPLGLQEMYRKGTEVLLANINHRPDLIGKLAKVIEEYNKHHAQKVPPLNELVGVIK